MWSPAMQRGDRAQQPIRVDCAAYDTSYSYTSPLSSLLRTLFEQVSRPAYWQGSCSFASRILANQTVWLAMHLLFMPFPYPSLLLLNYVTTRHGRPGWVIQNLIFTMTLNFQKAAHEILWCSLKKAISTEFPEHKFTLHSVSRRDKA
jgi:hypothetical protein